MVIASYTDLSLENAHITKMPPVKVEFDLSQPQLLPQKPSLLKPPHWGLGFQHMNLMGTHTLGCSILQYKGHARQLAHLSVDQVCFHL